MKPLSNPRHEAFAQGLYSGETADRAYVNAGYKPSRPNASRLTTNDNIVARLAELNERGQRQTDITKESITDMLLADREGARQNGQFAAAVSASEKIGKLHGLFVEKTENVNINQDVSDEPMTEDEWTAKFKPN